MGWFNYWGRFTLYQAVGIWSVAVDFLKSKQPRFLALLGLPFILSGPWKCATPSYESGRIWFDSPWKESSVPGKPHDFGVVSSWSIWVLPHNTNINNHCHSTRAVSLAWPLVSFGGFYALHARCDSYLRPFMYFMIVSGLRGSTLS